MKLKYVFAAAALCLGLVTIPGSADAINPRCGLYEVYGTTTTTIAHDTGQPYCDVQARTYRRAPNGGLYYTTSPWRLYEAVAIETRGTPVNSRRNCGRYWDKTDNYISPWSCRNP